VAGGEAQHRARLGCLRARSGRTPANSPARYWIVTACTAKWLAAGEVEWQRSWLFNMSAERTFSI
jgi:hypothetical protein